MQTKRTLVLSALTAAALPALNFGASAADAPKIAVDLTTLTSPFWTAYNKYLVSEAKAQDVNLLEPFTPSSTQRNR
jgi:ribose transport system substrate-binding protein